MRHTSRSSSWMDHKMAGKDHFERGNFEESLSCYRAALNPEYNCPPSERQIILSNVVACRLKIGGPAQFRAAVEDAKQCVALNDQWAKSHTRLASAYIALGGHSNDACNALQRALQLDPGNVTARQMLTRELRRDRVAPPPQPQPSAPPQDQDNVFSRPFTDMPRATTTTTDQRQEDQQYQREATSEMPDENLNVDDTLPILERVKLYYMKAISWYYSQSEDIRTLFKVALTILVLYVAFGGRFGLGSAISGSASRAKPTRNYQRGGTPGGRGNYEPGNAYDRFYHGSQAQRRNKYAGGTYENPQTYEYHYKPRSRTNKGGQSLSVSFDSNLVPVLILLGISYLCYRMGINPFHVLMMMNLFTLQHRGWGFRRMYGMGYGVPRWGGGGRPAAFARPRNGWY